MDQQGNTETAQNPSEDTIISWLADVPGDRLPELLRTIERRIAEAQQLINPVAAL